jgi:hypothetical protein
VDAGKPGYNMGDGKKTMVDAIVKRSSRAKKD